ncbi:efflux RND transporter permease subunit [Sediminispirochaeta bajacaliforniensis]|uniref:efflux RND transporter permease subunit n=1 Tax=Sediminispirochaeta bajacaliforniensis TaxID=148 RepID=UPI00037E1772|nr:MMPL family transporter [Sediminispirochaeta bajacaliforniensis]
MKKIVQHPKLIIGIILVVTLVLGFQIPNIVIDNDVKNYFPEDHPSNIRMEELDDIFSGQVMMAISVTNDEGTIFTPEVIDAVSNLVEAIEPMAHVEDVDALTNSDFPTGTEDGMAVGPLVWDDFDNSPEAFATLKEHLLEWPQMYRRALFSDDFTSTQLIVSIEEGLPSEEMSVIYKNVEDDIAKQKELHEGLTFRLAGDPVIFERAKDYMYSDLGHLVPVVILVVLFCLYFSFRRIRGTLLPLIAVTISTIWTIGIMALFGVKFTVVSTCLPVLLIAVGSAYGIHMMNHYYAEIAGKEGKVSFDEHRALVTASSSHVAKPILLAGFTTIVGFASVTTSPIVPLKQFGIFAAVGSAIALLLSLTFIPAILVVSPPKQRKHEEKQHKTEEGEGALMKIYGALSRRHWKIIFISLVVVGVSLWGLLRLDIQSALLDYFPSHSTMRVDTDYISDKFGGTTTFSAVVRADEGKSIIDPELLKSMDDLSLYLQEHHPEIGKIISFTDFIKRMNQIMNYPPATVEATSPETGTESGQGSNQGFGMDSFFDDDTSLANEPAATAEASDDGFGSFFDDAELGGEAETAAATADTHETGQDPTEKYNYDTYNTEMTYRDFLALLEDAISKRAGYTMSVDELVKGIEKGFNYKGADYYEIPYDPAKYPVASRKELGNLVSQYLLLYSGSLDDYANDPLDPDIARMLIQLKTHKTSDTDAVIKDINTYVAKHFPEGYRVECTGVAEMEKTLTDMVISSQLVSLFAALLIVFVIVAISYRSLAAGIFGIIPLSMAILVNFGIMGITGIRLDMVTSIIASIAIGIGVDYTIHFLDNYHHERLASDDLELVTRNTILLSGQAIIINAVSVALGFLVLTLSSFVVLRYIGLLVAIIMITSSLAAMTILPVLLNIFKPAFISRPANIKRPGAETSGKEE